MDLTIIIPTKNRYKYIEMLVRYYSSINFLGNLLILDSSQNSIFNDQSNLFNKYNNLNIKHFYSKYTPILAAKEYLNEINTNYVTLTGDDDYQILTGINSSINYLEMNKDINSVRGNCYLFDMVSNSKVNAIYDYNGYEYLQCSTLDRIIKFFDHPRSVSCNIWRSNAFINSLQEFINFNEINKCPDRYFNDEILFTSVLVSNNKIKRIDSNQFVMSLNLQRLEDRKWEKLNYNNLLKSIKYTHNKLVSILLKHENKVLPIDEKIILKSIEKFIFKKYIPATKKQNKYDFTFRNFCIKFLKIIKILNLLKKIKNIFYKDIKIYKISEFKKNDDFKYVFKIIEN